MHLYLLNMGKLYDYCRTPVCVVHSYMRHLCKCYLFCIMMADLDAYIYVLDKKNVILILYTRMSNRWMLWSEFGIKSDVIWAELIRKFNHAQAEVRELGEERNAKIDYSLRAWIVTNLDNDLELPERKKSTHSPPTFILVLKLFPTTMKSRHGVRGKSSAK